MTLSTLLPVPTWDGARWNSRAVVHGVDLRLEVEPATGSTPGLARLTVWTPATATVVHGSPAMTAESAVQVSASTAGPMVFARAMAALEPSFTLELAQEAIKAQRADWGRYEW